MQFFWCSACEKEWMDTDYTDAEDEESMYIAMKYDDAPACPTCGEEPSDRP